MILLELFCLCVTVGYHTIRGSQNLNSYHVETAFLPLHSTVDIQMERCNDSYSPREIIRQIAEETQGQFTIICNISNQTNDTAVKTCLDGKFIDIEIQFHCSSPANLVTFRARYPYDNFTKVINHNCSNPVIEELKLLNQSNDVYWSTCVDISINVMKNCSVECIGTTCFINTVCVHEIDRRCLISKYVKLTYECVHNSSTLLYEGKFGRGSDESFLVEIACVNRRLVHITDVSLETIAHSCYKQKTLNECLISNEDKTLINDACNSKENCSMFLRPNFTCDSTKTYAYYIISYKCSKSESIRETNCKPVNEILHLKCDIGHKIVDESLIIKFDPPQVAHCLKESNISLEFITDVCKPQLECAVNLSSILIHAAHTCLVFQRHIHVDYKCIQESSHDIGEAFPVHTPTFKPYDDLTTTAGFDDSLTTPKEEITNVKTVSIGPIIGGTVGSITLVAVFVVFVYCLRRVQIRKHKTDGQSADMVGSLIRQNSIKDYTGVQMVVFPCEGDKHLTDEIYTEIVDDPRKKFESERKENLNGKGRGVDNGNCATGYTLAKPISNTLQLPNVQFEMTQTDSGYSMAKPISTAVSYEVNCTQSSSDLAVSNKYDDFPEGVYDQSNSRRNKNDTDVYDRATDGTYDTANHCTKRRTDDDDIAYDHFTGPTSIENYDLVMRHNQVVADDTYGVN